MSEELRHIQLSCMARNLPFVTFRLPQQAVSTTYIQTTQEEIRWDSENIEPILQVAAS